MESQFFGVLNIHRGDPGDPLGINILQFDLDPISQGQEDGEFMGGVDTLDI